MKQKLIMLALQAILKLAEHLHEDECDKLAAKWEKELAKKQHKDKLDMVKQIFVIGHKAIDIVMDQKAGASKAGE